MPTCLSPKRFIYSFERNVAKLERRYRSIRRDPQDLFQEIAEDYRHRCGARRVPRMRLPSRGLSIWKYRCGSRDRRRGRSGGFRVICLFREADSTMNPILIFDKAPGDATLKPKQIDALVRVVKDLDQR